MKEEFIEQTKELMKRQHFDSLAIANLDFTQNTFTSFELKNKVLINKGAGTFFDLASLTKPLTLSATWLIHPELFDPNLILLLEHRAGLPSGGRLSSSNWQKILLQYPIKESETLYSDYSALRLMLELERKTQKTLRSLCSGFWDQELVFWKELKDPDNSPSTGFRRGNEIRGQVHDPNAYWLGLFCAHAGLFATIGGLSRSLINLNREFNLIEKIKKELVKIPPTQRFVKGWDRVLDPETSFAGNLASKKTFGHLGFTGTSIWIDPEKMRGQIILTNATQNFWYERDGLKELRRTLGNMLWTLK